MTKRPHYYYKIAEETATGKALQEFMNECQTAEETAQQWADRHGVDCYYESPNGMAGGIAAVEFAEGADTEGWEAVHAPDGRTLYVPQENTGMEKDMYSLPVVSEAKLIGILGFKQRISQKTGKPYPYTFGDETPVIFRHLGHWYADVPYECSEADCTATDDKEFYRRRMAAINVR